MSYTTNKRMNSPLPHSDPTELPESSTSQIVAVLATLVFCFGLFHFYLPDWIEQKWSQIQPVKQDQALVASNKTQLSQELRDHVKKFKKSEVRTEFSKSDFLSEEFTQDMEAFEDDMSETANEILTNRFKLPDLNNENINEGFSPPEGLEDVFTFWTHIFGVYDLDHIVFYNQDYTGIVYSVLDFSELRQGGSSSGLGGFKSQMIAQENRRIQKMLNRVTQTIEEGGKLTLLGKEERRIAEILIKNKEHVSLSFNDLKSSLKYRAGFSHRIKKAIVESGAYLEEMQRIFTERGLPKELTAIPFVESAFNLRAKSHAGAAGIWQFITDTGRRYLRIDEFVDERFDPILAAYAAATHLAHEYKFLGSWPLTINAYNTGPGRMLQAKNQLGTTDIATIIKKFKGSGYGFDSRNYYPEIIAALHVIENREHFFGDLKVHPVEKYEYLAMPSPMNIKDLARLAGLNLNTVSEMNLGLSPEVISGRRKLPKGYLVKIPPEAKQDILVAMQELHREIQYATHHVVKRGDSLKKIAKVYDISIQELAQANRLLPGQKLKNGDVIRLPGRDDFEYSSLSDESQMVVPDKLNVPVF